LSLSLFLVLGYEVVISEANLEQHFDACPEIYGVILSMSEALMLENVSLLVSK